jgi:2-(1,2-epoxy-1,2-dihydrophenyl)acetyl-CoA isomerase
MTPVVQERVGAVATVTLNRPDRLNAMNVELMEELRTSLTECAEDVSVRCVVLSAAGASFCAGGDADLNAERRRPSADAAPGAALIEAERMLRHHAESVELLYTMPKPVVAAVRGHAVGGGLSLALAADLRVASETAKFRVGYLGAGLSGDFGISYLLPEVVGAASARRIAFLDERVEAAQALALGLVTEVVPDDRLDIRVAELAQALAAMPTLALGKLKENLVHGRRVSLRDAIRHEAVNQRLVALTEDASEAGSAFKDKRRPDFHGR